MEGIKNKLSGYFSGQEKVVMAFLYGSYARGTAMADSDVDIAVYLRESYTDKDVERIWDEAAALLGKDVELLVLNNAKENIAWSAIRGVRLVIKDWAFYIRYMLRTSFDAMDFQGTVEDIWRMKQELKHARN